MAQKVAPISETESFINRPRILLVDEHLNTRQNLARLLSEHYEIDAAGDAPTALTLARERDPDLVVADVRMRAFDDFNLLCAGRRDAWGKLPIILYTTTYNEDSDVPAAKIKTNDDAVIPFSERQLLALVRAHLKVAQERQESIRSLRLSEERVRTLQTMLKPGVWVAGPNGEVTGEWAWWWEKMTGQTPEQYAGFGWQDVAHLEDKPRALKIWRSALRNKTPFQMELRTRQHDGSYKYIRAQGAPVRDADGNVREWIGTIFDIDDQKQAEETLRRNDERYRTFMSM